MKKHILSMQYKDIVITDEASDADKEPTDFKIHVSSLYQSDPKFAYPPIAFIKDNDPWKSIANSIINPLAPKYPIFNYKKFLPNENRRKKNDIHIKIDYDPNMQESNRNAPSDVESFITRSEVNTPKLKFNGLDCNIRDNKYRIESRTSISGPRRISNNNKLTNEHFRPGIAIYRVGTTNMINSGKGSQKTRIDLQKMRSVIEETEMINIPGIVRQESLRVLDLNPSFNVINQGNGSKDTPTPRSPPEDSEHTHVTVGKDALSLYEERSFNDSLLRSNVNVSNGEENESESSKEKPETSAAREFLVSREMSSSRQRKYSSQTKLTDENKNLQAGSRMTSEQSDRADRPQRRKIRQPVRRKSCTCYLCGGTCNKLAKVAHLVLPSDNREVIAQPELAPMVVSKRRKKSRGQPRQIYKFGLSNDSKKKPIAHRNSLSLALNTINQNQQQAISHFLNQPTQAGNAIAGSRANIPEESPPHANTQANSPRNAHSMATFTNIPLHAPTTPKKVTEEPNTTGRINLITSKTQTPIRVNTVSKNEKQSFTTLAKKPIFTPIREIPPVKMNNSALEKHSQPSQQTQMNISTAEFSSSKITMVIDTNRIRVKHLSKSKTREVTPTKFKSDREVRLVKGFQSMLKLNSKAAKSLYKKQDEEQALEDLIKLPKVKPLHFKSKSISKMVSKNHITIHENSMKEEDLPYKELLFFTGHPDKSKRIVRKNYNKVNGQSSEVKRDVPANMARSEVVLSKREIYERASSLTSVKKKLIF